MLIDKWSEYNCYRITQKVMAWWAFSDHAVPAKLIANLVGWVEALYPTAPSCVGFRYQETQPTV